MGHTVRLSRLAVSLNMNFSSLVLCLLVTCSATKISPFVPRDTVKYQVEIARVNYLKEKQEQAIERVITEGKIEAHTVKSDEEETTTENKEDPTNSSSDVVPIIVGSVLAGLIMVVLVSYFIVRARRNKE